MSKKFFLLFLSAITVSVSVFLTCNLATTLLASVGIPIAIAIALAYEGTKYAIAIGWCGFTSNEFATSLFLCALVLGSIGATAFSINESMEEEQRTQFQEYQKSSLEVQALQQQLKMLEQQINAQIVTADLQIENARKLQRANQITKSSRLLQQQTAVEKDLLQQHEELSSRLQIALKVPHETFWYNNKMIAMFVVLFVAVILEFNSIFALRAFSSCFEQPKKPDLPLNKVNQFKRKNAPYAKNQTQQQSEDEHDVAHKIKEAVLMQQISPTIKNVMDKFKLTQRKARKELQVLVDEGVLAVQGKRFILVNP